MKPKIGTLRCSLFGHQFIYYDRTYAAILKELPSEYCRPCGIKRDELQGEQQSKRMEAKA